MPDFLVDEFSENDSIDLLHEARAHSGHDKFVPVVVSTNRLDLARNCLLLDFLLSVTADPHALTGGGEMAAMLFRSQ